MEFVGLALMDPKYGITSTTQWPAFRTSHIFWADTARHIRTSTCSSVLLNSECTYITINGTVTFTLVFSSVEALSALYLPGVYDL